ncbi:apolipoprotein N-acyltransferase [Aeromicrobium terrae]|uniref:Apolipoprotein N-acyltransferase n=1 Tax=Aeromicrobium terrae TaxID=2498846 RepID=A0A5C8NPM8_9ACTN|nr:apolipoprotein N-acyltransferase [Aeromicrobium terrae]TXL63086.1 apolipoprotein N-acyltransferase [Aeromicrobium terrae]
MSWRVAGVLAALCGVVCSLAFDPAAVPYAMVVGVAGLIWVARQLGDARRRVVLAVGAVYGLAFMGPLIWWMNAVSEGAYVALVLAETVFFAVIMLALRAACRLPRWPLWGAAVWVLGETARSSFPFSGFPWGRLVHTSLDTPFEAYTRLIGMPATSAVLFVVAAMLVVAATSGSWRARLVPVGVVLALATIGALLPTGVAGQAGDRRIALVQGDVPGAFLTWPRGAIFELHADETRRLIDRIRSGDEPQPDAVLWPENATDIDPYHDTAARSTIETLSRGLDAPILVGGIFDGATTDTARNAGVVWDADGPGQIYVKRKPVPYGEYVPFRHELGGLVPRFDRDIPRDFLPGKKPGALRIGNLVVGDTICWDIAYDGVVRGTVKAGGQVLVVQTSNASFTGTSQPEQQWRISRLRAIETGRWVVVPSTNGISGIADAHGNVVKRAPLHEPATLSADVPLASGLTPALRIGEPLEYLLLALGLLGWWLGRNPRDDG